MIISPWETIVDRQLGYAGFTPELHAAMAETRTAIIGAGGNGAVLDLLVRSGFTRFTIIDPDTVDETNLNRLPFSRRTVGRSKVEAWKRYLTGINPDCDIKTYEWAITRHDAVRLEACLKGVSLLFLGTTDVEANLVVSRVASRMGIRMLIGPASSGCLVVGTFIHDNGHTLERLAGFETETQELEAIDYASLKKRYDKALAFPGRTKKLEPGVWDAITRGELPARSCGFFVRLVNAAMAFEALKNVAAMRAFPIPGGKVFAIPEVLVFDPWTGCSYVFNAASGNIIVPGR